MRTARVGNAMHHVFPRCRYPQFERCEWNRIEVSIAEHAWYHQIFWFNGVNYLGEKAKMPMDVWEAMAMLNPLIGTYQLDRNDDERWHAWHRLFIGNITPKQATSVLYEYWTPGSRR